MQFNMIANHPIFYYGIFMFFVGLVFAIYESKQKKKVNYEMYFNT